ncbi:MAG: hypothetical protein EOP53_00825 [Sphingobacteriales bacterium]|nr:MAG: hypothetical protein EOP53_00825 [Sphingobacteriales bacterium]
MINYLSHIKLLNIFWGLLALFMLNISIDVADATPASTAENLAFNEQESMIEFVLEEILGMEDAIPESEDNDATQNSFLKKNSLTDCFILSVVKGDMHHTAATRSTFFYRNDFYFSNSYIDIVSPPPDI